MIGTKSVLFRETGVNYADCRTGQVVIVPDGPVLRGLETDYRKKEDSGMFGDAVVPFSEVLNTLQRIQGQLGGLQRSGQFQVTLGSAAEPR